MWINMGDIDLETDCAPILENAHCKIKDWDCNHFLKGHAENSKHMIANDMLESGYDSFRSATLQSVNFRKCRLKSDEENLLPISNLQDLSIRNNLESYADEGCDLKSDFFIEKPRDQSYVKYEDDVNWNEIDEIEETFQQDEDGDTRLHAAVIQYLRDLSLYYVHLAPDRDYINIANNYYQTPLHLAVITKQPLIARKLITAGARLDSKDHKGNTPLHIAAKEGYAFVAQVLLGPVPLEELNGNKKHQQIPQNLEIRNYDGQVCLHLAAEGGHLETLKVLLSKGADINARDGKSGRAILHYAAESGCMPLVKFLLKYPALNVNTTTYGGLTACMLASGRNHVDVVNVLKENGAVCESQDSDEEEDMDEEIYDDIKINGRLYKKNNVQYGT